MLNTVLHAAISPQVSHLQLTWKARLGTWWPLDIRIGKMSSSYSSGWFPNRLKTSVSDNGSNQNGGETRAWRYDSRDCLVHNIWLGWKSWVTLELLLWYVGYGAHIGQLVGHELHIESGICDLVQNVGEIFIYTSGNQARLKPRPGATGATLQWRDRNCPPLSAQPRSLIILVSLTNVSDLE